MSKAAVSTLLCRGSCGRKYSAHRQILKSAVAGSFGKSVFLFVGNCQTIFQRGHTMSPRAFAPIVSGRSCCSTPSPLLCSELWRLLVLTALRLPHCFTACPSRRVTWSVFSPAIAICMTSLGRRLFRSLAHFLNWIVHVVIVVF